MAVNTGDIYQLGRHFLLCGDSTDEYTVKEFVGDIKIKAVICDPPYGISYVETRVVYKERGEHKPIANDDINSEPAYYRFSLDWLKAVVPHLEPKNSFYIFSSDKMLFPLREGMAYAGIHFGQLLVWVKNNSVLGRLDYLPQHEMIIYGWRGAHEFFKTKDKSILYCPKPNKSKLHPTMKPLPLIRRLILNSTTIGDYVYDGFLGSGTTLLACEQTKRNCIGIEMDPEYCQAILERFEALTGIKAVKQENYENPRQN